MRNHACLTILFALLTGCASQGAKPPDGAGFLMASATWQNVCYRSMRQDAMHLAGAGAIDCGMQHIDDPAHGRVENCARKAVAHTESYFFGYQSYGDDSGFCDVAVKSADGQLWSLYYDSDVTGQGGKDASNAAIWISRCKNIEFKPGTIGRGSFFAMGDCAEAKDVLKSIVAQRVKSKSDK